MFDFTVFDFTIHHIRFTVEATTPIEMDEFKGSALRGAWTGYMRRAYCGAPPNVQTDPMHEAICPVCYLTSRDTGSESRRPFALQPPHSRQPRYEVGERFNFGFTLFGNAHALFPYVLLAVREVGETHGIGRRLGAGQCRGGERGRYRLHQVSAHDPHGALVEILFQEPDTLVAQPSLAVTGESIARRAAAVAAIARYDDNRVQIRLNTPLRLIHQNRLMRQFSTVAFFQRLIERTYGLGQHFSQTPEQFERSALRKEVEALLPLAEAVQIVDDRTQWWDVKGYSSRLKKPQYLGGLVGNVTLASKSWAQLLPYLLLGESMQLGKNVVKGGGLYRVCD